MAGAARPRAVRHHDDARRATSTTRRSPAITSRASTSKPAKPRSSSRRRKDQGARRVWSDSKGRIWVSYWNTGHVGMYDPASRAWKEWKLPGNAHAYSVWVDDRRQGVAHRLEHQRASCASIPSPRNSRAFRRASAQANVRQMLGRSGRGVGRGIGRRSAGHGARAMRLIDASHRACGVCDVATGARAAIGPALARKPAEERAAQGRRRTDRERQSSRARRHPHEPARGGPAVHGSRSCRCGRPIARA